MNQAIPSGRATRLHQKLERIRLDPQGCKDFILCDAKDADMASGTHAPGLRRDGSGRLKTRRDYLDQMRSILAKDDIDLMLTSVSTMERLHLEEHRFDGTGVARAIRANDATDVWMARGAGYMQAKSLPFRSANLAEVCKQGIADLGLYSITFNNDAALDEATLDAFSEFRAECARVGFQYFLEVFNPVASADLSAKEMPFYVNDCIVRALAGLSQSERPWFLKVVYNGRRALEELVAYDDRLIVGVMGGGGGTMHDSFKLLGDAQSCGARLALFGRKVNLAEDPLTMLALMRRLTLGEVRPREAVHLYHDALAQQGIEPIRLLADDLVLTDPCLKD